MRSSIWKYFLGPLALAGGRLPERTQRAWSRRAHLMMHHTWLLVLGAVLLIAGLAAAAFYYGSRPTALTFAVPGTNTEDVRLVQALAAQFVRDRASIRLKPDTVPGPAQSAAAIDDETADLAVVRSDLPMPKSGLAVAVLRQNVVVMIVPAAGSEAKAKPAKAANGQAKTSGRSGKSEKIEKIEDLPGRRIGIIGRGSTPNNTEVLNVILRQYEIPPDKVTIVPIDSENVRAALRKDPVDVIVTVGPVTSRYITDAIASASTDKEQPTFIAIGAAEAIASRLPAYESAELKEGVFGGKKPLPDDSVETIAFNHYIVARRGLSESRVSDFTRQLFGVRQALQHDYPAIAKIEKPDTDKDAAVQAHPGAAAYLDNDQKTFFDRYSDLLYWSMIAMGFLGSAITWVASYTKADERIRRMRVIEYLLDVVRKARIAQTFEEIERLRTEVDEVLKRTLREVEHNELDEPALMAFSLALDQAQLALSDRRSTLAARGMQERIETVPAAGAAAAASGLHASGAETASTEAMPLRFAAKAAEQG